MDDEARKYTIGFTLIELLVSMGILAVVMAISAVGYNNYTKKQTLVQAGLTLKNALRNVATAASSGEKPVGITCDRLLGYEISFTSSSYTVVPKCSPDAPTIPPVTTTLSPLLVFNPVPNPILFQVLNRGVGNPVVINLVTIFSTAKYVMTVSSQGEITSEGLQ